MGGQLLPRKLLPDFSRIDQEGSRERKHFLAQVEKRKQVIDWRLENKPMGKLTWKTSHPGRSPVAHPHPPNFFCFWEGSWSKGIGTNTKECSAVAVTWQGRRPCPFCRVDLSRKADERMRDEERTCIVSSPRAVPKGPEKIWVQAAAGHEVDSWQILFTFPPSLKQHRQSENTICGWNGKNYPTHIGVLKNQEKNGYIFLALWVCFMFKLLEIERLWCKRNVRETTRFRLIND